MSKQIMIVFGVIRFNSISNTAEVEKVDRVDLCNIEEAEEHANEAMQDGNYDSHIIPSLYSGSITWNEHQLKNSYNPPAKQDRAKDNLIYEGDIIRHKTTRVIVYANDEWNGETHPDWELFNVEAFFLDYVNNYITVAGIADIYGVSEEMATELINKGREINNSK